MKSAESVYLEELLGPIKACANYAPKFGQGATGSGLNLAEFQALYQADQFYHWFGLDNPLMYAAHKAAGGMTSIYRQIGIGCERLLRKIIQDSLNLNDSDVKWSYELYVSENKNRTLSLDGRIPINKIEDSNKKKKVLEWMNLASEYIGVEKKVVNNLNGVVFEIRQGYKSKDSKRQNADIANAATAYSQAYLPCAIILSSQIDNDVLARYRNAKWVVLTGVSDVEGSLISTYGFFRDVIGYDLALFFQQNSKYLRSEVEFVLKSLLTTSN
jgi:hypothetical protein